jgi:hypothetical protein
MQGVRGTQATRERSGERRVNSKLKLETREKARLPNYRRGKYTMS